MALITAIGKKQPVTMNYLYTSFSVHLVILLELHGEVKNRSNRFVVITCVCVKTKDKVDGP